MADQLKVSSREYKDMLDHRLVLDRKPAAEAFFADLASCARRLKRMNIECKGEYKKALKRAIVFLDTPDHAVALNELIFRQRIDLEKGGCEYTLKCRSPDRHIAAAAATENLGPEKGELKFEEDIGAPFVVRFSRPNTVSGPRKRPATLKQAARMFPALGRFERDGRSCPPDFELEPAEARTIFGRVLKGPDLSFGKTEAELAPILWSDGGNGRPIIAEFSFHYDVDSKSENVAPQAARSAKEFFAAIQRMDWFLPGSRIKTQFVFGEG